MPIASSAEQHALASIREWATRAGTLALVRRLEPGGGAAPPGGGAAPPGGGASPPDHPAAPVGSSQSRQPLLAGPALGLPRDEAR